MPWTCSSHLQWLQANLAATRAQEVQIQEDITISHTSNVLEPITLLQKESLKYTCLDCVYKTKTKSHMEKHVKNIQSQSQNAIVGLAHHRFWNPQRVNFMSSFH